MEQLQTRPAHSASPIRDRAIQNQLLARREKLRNAVPSAPKGDKLGALLQEVDDALARMETGTYGICETCHDTIESDQLLRDPLRRNCLDHLSPAEQRALEHDLDLAFQVQRGLLPKPAVGIDGWSMAYHYEPAGSVSGDYCDFISAGDGSAFFFVGDVTGKGVAASMLVAQLYAIFRSLAISTTSPGELLSKANRIFCEGVLASHFATVLCGRIGKQGAVEISNAGHCLPLHVCGTAVKSVPSTGLPLGLLCETDYGTQSLSLQPGDSLVLYTDGLTEAFDSSGEQYGMQRFSSMVKRKASLAPSAFLAESLQDLERFRSGARKSDDLTVMVLRHGK